MSFAAFTKSVERWVLLVHALGESPFEPPFPLGEFRRRQWPKMADAEAQLFVSCAAVWDLDSETEHS